ncbi:MAG: T9SS type A sorting domain-containing protein, partial [Cytophagales bacterium]|nr:T9SS type A sorting domain-containing protein [Cytophagales bacterium]
QSIQVSVFPNPATDKLTIQLVNLESALVDLVNPEGKTVWSGTPISLGTNSMDISGLSSGVYILVVKNISTVQIIKLVIN